MAMPDIGVGPPPPPDVSAQMRPTSSVSSNGGPDLGALMAQLAGGQMPTGPDITPKVLDVQPLLSQIARQVPSLGPDVDRLNVELKAHMAGLPNAIAQMGAGSGGPAPGASGAPGPPAQAAAPQGAASTPAAQPAPPALTSQMGAMDTAMQLEVKLPSIGKDDPTLMPYIQGFIARMRDEVPKVVQGDTEAISPPPQPAPTDAMLSKIPVSF